ncbi:MAG: glycosyltransferase [Clostridia bacterium]|nr:glycosyltransferase [Clostridia bacterium]
MKLQLLIPQYNETTDVMRPLLESIATQQGVDLKNDIEVLIGNDGSDIKLSEEFLGGFSYPVRYVQFDHAGLPGTRGRLFDMATADYVMF